MGQKERAREAARLADAQAALQIAEKAALANLQIAEQALELVQGQQADDEED